MAKGNYIVVPNDEKTDIVFHLSPTADQDISNEQQDLLFGVQVVIESLRTIYKENARLFENYFDQLLKLSQVGLVGENAQPQLAKRALEQIKTEVINRESGKIKNDYLKRLGIKAFWFGFPPLIVGIVFNYLNCKENNFECLNCIYTANLLVLWAGTMTGVWLSFAITRTYIGFSDLTIIEKDRLEPALRLIFTGILSLIFGLLFIKKSIVINFGDLSSDQIATDSISAFIIGVVLGINEKIIGKTLSKKTSALLEK
jgi:hypothetical protein